jgi:hypothetical protein
MWIGATDGLQHQTESESDVESTFTAGKITHTKTIVTYYDFNADINIAPPDLVREMSGQNPKRPLASEKE